MKTYQDLKKVSENDNDRMNFVLSVIREHQSSDIYQTAVLADEYDRKQNRTIVSYQKLLYTITGQAVPDNFSANYKITSGFFNRFVTQQNQFLLGNGVTWENPDTEDKLGKDFDIKLQEAGKNALVGAVSFGFWNNNHLEVFKVTEFAPLMDEENGSVRAGVRFWQIDSSKPLRATLYEENGYTEYIWEKDSDNRDSIGRVLQPKRAYIEVVQTSIVDGTQIIDYRNYPGFPIVPLWGNPHHQSEIVGIREQIDAYDLIKSGFANDLDDASQIYWTIQNAGGMDDMDLVKFVERMKTVRAAVVDDSGSTAEAHTMEVPFNSREALLDRLESDLYKDFMAFNPSDIVAGAVTATQIRAAYEPINNKVDQFEYCVHEFLQEILDLAGIEDNPTFTRSVLVNVTEEIQSITMSAQYLSRNYIVEKILNLLGDGDKVEEVIKEIDETDYRRMTSPEEEEEEEEEENTEEVTEENQEVE